MFTPIESSIGAFLLHQASSNLLYQNGDILGASGFIRRVFSAPTKELLAFFTGMALSYLPLKALAPQLITVYPSVPITLPTTLITIGVGALVGLGTKMSNGCTSGHMLCGLSRLSGRSATAVAIFFPVAIITHHLVHPTLYTEACPGDVPCYTPVYPTEEATAWLVVLAAVVTFASQNIPKLFANYLPARSDDSKDAANPRTIAREATQFFSGLLFALGLHISQMSNPAKVASFLSFPVLKQWDPSLVLVILFGVLPNLIENQLQGFDRPPMFADKFSLPAKTFKNVDWRFVVGAAAFGVGWGLTGTCPGPAILRAFAQPVWGALWFGGFSLGGKLKAL